MDYCSLGHTSLGPPGTHLIARILKNTLYVFTSWRFPTFSRNMLCIFLNLLREISTSVMLNKIELGNNVEKAIIQPNFLVYFEGDRDPLKRQI